jgi:hypothetical protein
MTLRKKALAIMAFSAIIAGCIHAGGADDSGLTACTDPRPQMCTMEYNPVCGMLRGGGEKTYSTGCTACSDSAVTGYRAGEC